MNLHGLIVVSLLILIGFSAAVTKTTADGGRPSIGDTTSNAGSAYALAHAQQWVGAQLTFLEIPKFSEGGENEREYTSFHVLRQKGVKRDRSVETKSGNPVYRTFVGKTVTVVSVEPLKDENGLTTDSFIFLLHEPTTNTDIYAIVDPITFLDDLALTSELDTAKREWFNKTVYSRDETIYQYDSQHEMESAIQIPFGERLLVTDVIWGMAEDDPIWIVVRTSTGEEGYYKTKETDVPGSSGITADSDDPTLFFDTDPRSLPGWGPSVVDEINDHEVLMGMTTDQVICAKGAPSHENTDTDSDGGLDQWVYHDMYVYFKGGVVVDIQQED